MNFLELCKGNLKNKEGELLSYKKCKIFRIALNGFIQSGDLNEYKGAKCIYGKPFEDENFNVKHDTHGVLGMVKCLGKDHSNESQFYITLNALSCFDKKFVAFGKVVKGYDIIERMTEIECMMQRPVKNIEIIECGEFLG